MLRLISIFRYTIASGFVLASGLAGAVCVSLLATPASAVATCPATGLSGCTTTDPGDAKNAVEIDEDALTFLAKWSPSNQSNSTISANVLAILAASGFTDSVYLGRQDGTGDLHGTSVTTTSSDGGLSGTWTFSPGSSGDVGQFIAIHAGGGQTEILYQINSPGLSGVWDTSENINGGGNQATLSNFDLFGGPSGGSGGGGSSSVPEPASIALVGVALAGLGAMRRRQRA